MPQFCSDFLELNFTGKSEFRSKIVFRNIAELIARPDNPRIHSKRQLKIIADLIRRFGFLNPVLIDSSGRIVAGHARVEAARQLGRLVVPTITLGHLSPAELKAYAIADNRSAEHSEWDRELLSLNVIEIATLDIDLDLTLTGFDEHEIALLRDIPKAKDVVDPPSPEPDRSRPATSRLGDVWVIGDAVHRVTCGDACERPAYERPMGTVKADMIITDMPFNVPIEGHVSGLGKVKHREFVQASGEMTRAQFGRFMLAFILTTDLPDRAGDDRRRRIFRQR